MCEKRKVVVIPTFLKENTYVTEIDNVYSAYYPIIGCRCYDVVELGGNDALSVDCFVDDEGMINGSTVNEYWLRAYKQGLIYSPLFGICVLSMSDRETGDGTETDLNLVRDTLKEYGFTDDELSF